MSLEKLAERLQGILLMRLQVPSRMGKQLGI